MINIGAVSYLNSKPLIHGLAEQPDIRLHLDVPSALLDGLLAGRLEVALLPVIDYQRMAGLKLIPAGAIACDGPTLTVRIFSRIPLEQIQTLACDPDSHTSVALARIVLAELYGIKPEFVDLSNPEIPSRLLIGDKVVSHEPQGHPYQLDLGEAWKLLTGMPFVFACWTARQESKLGDLPRRLQLARIRGLQQIDAILKQHATALQWPVALARRYYTEYLRFEIGPSQLRAIEKYHQLAYRYGLITHEPWPLICETVASSD